MALAIDNHTVANTTASSTTCTSTGITTSASGLILFVSVGWYGSGAAPTVSDNKSNGNATQIGSTASYSGDTNIKFARFYWQNAAGGSSHTFTATFGAAQDVITIWPVSISGGLTSGSLDLQTAVNEDTASPYTSQTSATTAQANEVLIASTASLTVSGTEILTWGNSFNALDAQGNANYFTGGQAYRIVSATGTYQSSVTSAGASAFGALTFLTSFKDITAGGAVSDLGISPGGIHLVRNAIYRM